MFDVDVFVEIIKQKNVQFIVNDEPGFLIEKENGISILNSKKEILKHVTLKELENIEIADDQETLIINKDIQVKVQEFFTVKF